MMDRPQRDSFADDFAYQLALQFWLEERYRETLRRNATKWTPTKRRLRRFSRKERDIARFVLMLRGEEEGAEIIREEWGAEDGDALIALLNEQKGSTGRR